MVHEAATQPISLTLAVLVFGAVAQVVRPAFDKGIQRLRAKVPARLIYPTLILSMGLVPVLLRQWLRLCAASAPTRTIISRLNHKAHSLAVYASPHHARFTSGWLASVFRRDSLTTRWVPVNSNHSIPLSQVLLSRRFRHIVAGVRRPHNRLRHFKACLRRPSVGVGRPNRAGLPSYQGEGTRSSLMGPRFTTYYKLVPPPANLRGRHPPFSDRED